MDEEETTEEEATRAMCPASSVFDASVGLPPLTKTAITRYGRLYRRMAEEAYSVD